MKWGIEDRRAAEWDGHNVYIDPDVKYVFYDVSTGKSRETHRSDADLPAMKQAIDQAVIMMQSCYKKKDFPPYHKSCSICKYNVLDLVGDPVCKKRNPNIEVMKRRSEFEETVTPPTLP
jgi:hypothetical protein